LRVHGARGIDADIARTGETHESWSKNLLDPHLEQLRDSEDEWERRVVPANFDRIDRLTRHAKAFREVDLAPTTRAAQFGQFVFLSARACCEDRGRTFEALARLSHRTLSSDVARRFFKELWRWDQVVFDVSGCR
jgi:hypothetical protein